MVQETNYKKFDLKPVTQIVEDLDVKFQTFQSENGYKISLEWDNWSGFLIVFFLIK